MSSTTSSSSDQITIDDRSTKARIRDAAIECFADQGVQATTARKVAETAGVSPALVIHHYNSMDGLRAACDTYVAATIRQEKLEGIRAGANLDVMEAIRKSKIKSLSGYLARVLTEDSPAVNNLVDDLVSDAVVYTEQGVKEGSIKSARDLETRTKALLMWTLGALVMHRHVNRILGVDLTNIDSSSKSDLSRYIASMYEILGSGIFTEGFMEKILENLPTSDDAISP